MLTIAYMPKSFEEIVGQEKNVLLLKKVIKKWENSPRVFLLHGPSGTGKTASIYSFIGGLERVYPNPLRVWNFASEKEIFSMDLRGGNLGVVIFENFDLISQEAQGLVINKIDRELSDHFCFFTTSHLHNICPGVRNRAVELRYDALSVDDIMGRVEKIIQEENIELDEVGEDIIYKIVKASKGSMRRALLLLNGFFTTGEEGFEMPSSEENSINILMALKEGNREKFRRALKELLKGVLCEVKEDFYTVIRNIMETLATGKKFPYYTKKYEILAEEWRGSIYILFQSVMQPWAINSFESDTTLGAFFWSLFYNIRGKVGERGPEVPGGSLLDKARKKRS